MLRLALLLLCGLLPGCVFAIEVDDDEWDGDHSQVRFAHWRSHSHGGGAQEAGVVSGRVLDQSRTPVAARVAAVYASGSHAQVCESDGTFSLGPLPEGTFSLRAATGDGQVAVLSGLALSKGQGIANLEVLLEPGATLLLSYEGSAESYRCALFHDGERVDDFTLRKGVQESVVVPAGRIPMQLYQGERVFAASEADLAAGSITPIVFRVD